MSVAIIVLVLASIAAGDAGGASINECDLHRSRNTFAGAIGGAAGHFLQMLIPPTIDINGNPAPDETVAGHLLNLALVGLSTIGMLTLVLGFVMRNAFGNLSA